MWCQNILRKRAILNDLITPICLRYFPCNNHNSAIALKHSIQRLLTSDACQSTINDVINQWSHRFEAEGISEPTESIEHIVAHVIGTKKITDIRNNGNDRLTANQVEKLESLCQSRLSRMPIEYIVGELTFRDITLKVVPPIFVPERHTELLIDIILKRLNLSQIDYCEMLEIGCGSGAISLALAHSSKKIKCTAIDMNPEACDLARTNGRNLNLTNQITVIQGTLKSNANIEFSNGPTDIDLNSGLFDLIVSNPPYIPTKKLSELQPEMQIYSDLRAWNGGNDGLNVIKPVLKYAARVLKPGGRLFLEVYPSHPEHIQFFTNKYPDLKLRHEHTYKDAGNNDRFVEITKIT